MRARAVVLLILLLMSCAAQALAASDDRYSYITLEDVRIRLDNGTAVIHVNYTVDDGTRLFFFLLGKQDLKNKLLKILNYEDAKIQRIDLSSADFTVYNASYSYGKGIYWYPTHDFNVVIPSLSVQSPQAARNFTNTKQFPGGMGFFAEPGPEPIIIMETTEIGSTP
jgi:hypothetical protein